MRINLYDLLYVKASINPKSITELFTFLIKNKPFFLPESIKEGIFKERSILTTPMAKIYNKYVEDKVYDNFSLIMFPRGYAGELPKGLLHQYVSLDVPQMVEIDRSMENTVRLTPELRNRLLIDATSMISTDGRTYNLKNADAFFSLVVRDALTHSYYANKYKQNWLRPPIMVYITKVYALLLSSYISRWFDLGQMEQDFITTVFASFMLGRMSDERGATGIVVSHARDFYLTDKSTVLNILKQINGTINKAIPETFEECIQLINSLGVKRVEISRPALASKFKTIAGDVLTTSVALEYPPYFTWAVLNAISGAKNQLNLFMKKQNMLKSSQRITDELSQSLPSLKV